ASMSLTACVACVVMCCPFEESGLVGADYPTTTPGGVPTSLFCRPALARWAPLCRRPTIRGFDGSCLRVLRRCGQRENGGSLVGSRLHEVAASLFVRVLFL